MSDKNPTKTPSITSTNMDSLNKKAVEILNEKGDDAFIKHVLTGDEKHGDAGKPLTYAEMRDRYG